MESTGLPFTHQTIVDAHFRACIEPYRNLLDQADIRPGMRVLDAGCRGDDFLPWPAELTGPTVASRRSAWPRSTWTGRPSA
ncbi:hypothetical protein [Streptomyces litmocidini]|uniref:hypothetical protein n=1 Tax=Streptomyces litmocidini TaxID=67318 RepID=UPI0037023FD1